jgi:gliding motility-associated-like protein
MGVIFRLFIISVLIIWLPAGEAVSQISAPGSAYSELTQYPVFPQNDPVFVYCGTSGNSGGTLQVTTALEGSKTFVWELYDPSNRSYESYFTDVSSGSQSQINQLADGGYRVTVVTPSGQQVYRAWVFNQWIEPIPEIPESNCQYFTLESRLDQADLVYYDPSAGTPVRLSSDPIMEWRLDEAIISRLPSITVYDPPAKDTEYLLYVTDRFGCEFSSGVVYQSIVTKASFTADPMNGEAPLEVQFTNTSENGDDNQFEWFFFKDLDEIKMNSPGGNVPVDSIMQTAINHSPLYTYENSGSYMVKLVSKKISEFYVCTDTVYLENYIVVDTSYIAAPNVFTPNGDGTNDNFVVKFWSMKEVKISIFNRWGRTVHVYENKNVEGFRNSWEVAAWDGRIGGRYASPGVYFYVIEAFGRDDTKRWKKGFVHLFREKD